MNTKRVLALYDQDRQAVRLFGMRREETPHIVRHISPSGEGVIIYSNLSSTNVEAVIQEQVAHFEQQGRDFSWVVCRHDTPANLKERLLAHGFHVEDTDAIMVLDIEDVPPTLLEPVQHDVQRITDPRKIDDVITIRQEVWQSDSSSAAQSLAKRLADSPQSLGLYVAYVEGKPVSTAQISFYQQGQFAGLVHAATLPGYRRRGLYTALIAIRIQEARRRGIRFLDADASPMSRPILDKLGFQWLTEACSYGWSFKDASSD